MLISGSPFEQHTLAKWELLEKSDYGSFITHVPMVALIAQESLFQLIS